jgi:hypothetical protein
MTKVECEKKNRAKYHLFYSFYFTVMVFFNGSCSLQLWYQSSFVIIVEEINSERLIENKVASRNGFHKHISSSFIYREKRTEWWVAMVKGYITAYGRGP